MGTKFRTLLAPIGVSTGDGRRFSDGGISLADLPMPFEWVRSREGGHDGAVSIGAIQSAKIMTHGQAVEDGWISAAGAKGLDPAGKGVYAQGEMFDDADRETMPTLAEDVATALHLASNGTLGPSVDLDSFEAKAVLAGTDDELSWEAAEAYYEEHGEEPPVELLITQGRVRAATLVSIPAFSETSRPFELVEAEPEATEAALIASITALTASITDHRPPVGLFALPALDGPTPVTWDHENGRVFGHLATWRTCHVGYEGVCVTPPREEGEQAYSWFHRYAVETEDGGTVWAGRITVGGGHAGLALNASSAMAVHDSKTVAAYVRIYSDEHGIAMAGAIEPGLDASTLAVLARRKVSGDWRETPSGLSLIEVLALPPGPRAMSEPGFPVAETYVGRSGRQTTLVASLGPVADGTFARRSMLSVEEIVKRTLAAERAEAERSAAEEAARAELARTLAPYDQAARDELAAALGEG
jgi:hypothetical protein